MSTTTTGVANASFNQVIKSTNGTFNIYLTLAFIIGAAFGVEESVILGLLPALGAIREVIEGIRKPRWTGNILVYLGAIVAAMVPWASGLWDSITPLVDYIIAKDWNLLIGAMLPIINIVWNLLREKPWDENNDLLGTKAPTDV